MVEESISEEQSIERIRKSPTGVKGLDQILDGGLPEGRATLVCGGPGCGKTMLATEFLVHGAEEYGEPGVFMAFEETPVELTKNAASLGFDLKDLIDKGKLFVDYVYIERSEIEETGEYDLEGLFIRLASAIEAVGAKRVALDTLETIFAGFNNESILRSEIRRLFRWLKDRGITAVVTGERGERRLTRYGLEEYISDCVILLENRMQDKIANRILRVVKYRGSSHGTDEYPFLISDHGLWVAPITSLGLTYQVISEFIPTGVPGLDEMLSGKGFYRGSSVLVSGSAGTGKTSLAASLIDGACRRGEPCLFFAFEESKSQIIRNMRSIGVDLQPWVDQGLLHFRAARPSQTGIETHLLTIQKLVEEINPSVVVVDPLTNLTSIGSETEVKSMLTRLIDDLKVRQITAIFTSLLAGGDYEAISEVGISSLMDIWILLRNLEANGERNRTIYVLKARGLAHSNQVREFSLTDHGIELVDVYIGPDGILTGSARLARQSQEKVEVAQRYSEIANRKGELARKRARLEIQIAELQAEIEADEAQFLQLQAVETKQQAMVDEERKSLVRARQIRGGNSSEKGDGE